MKRKKHLAIRIPVTIILVILAIWIVLLAANFLVNLGLRSYIKRFDPVDYSSKTVIKAQVNDNANEGLYKYFYTLDDEEEMKLLVLTDIHLGGGFWNIKKDLKSIYEIISMLQVEKPDLVILDGDNVFAVPGPVYNGGGTLNNRMVAKTVMSIFEHEGVQFTTVLGNHDTEVFDYSNRCQIGDLYENSNSKFALFHQDYTDEGEEGVNLPTVTNQLIPVFNKNTENLAKILLLVDTNSYVDNTLKAVLDWNYDIIRDGQVEWAKESINSLFTAYSDITNSKKPGVLAFFHIPIGEYEAGYRNLKANNFENTEDTEYIGGVWDEIPGEHASGRIMFGGYSRYQDNPQDADKFFETLGPDGINCLEACFCGHDHVNTADIKYKGVLLSYCHSVDNIAYAGIHESGTQRGCVRIMLKADGSWTYKQLNAYTDLGIDPSRFYETFFDHTLYPDPEP